MQELPASAQVVRSRWTQLQLLMAGSEPLPKGAGRRGEDPASAAHAAADNFSHPPSLPSIALASTGLPRKPEQLRCRRSLQDELLAGGRSARLPAGAASLPFPLPFGCFPFSPPHSRSPRPCGCPKTCCASPGAEQGPGSPCTEGAPGGERRTWGGFVGLAAPTRSRRAPSSPKGVSRVRNKGSRQRVGDGE